MELVARGDRGHAEAPQKAAEGSGQSRREPAVHRPEEPLASAICVNALLGGDPGTFLNAAAHERPDRAADAAPRLLGSDGLVDLPPGDWLAARLDGEFKGLVALPAICVLVARHPAIRRCPPDAYAVERMECHEDMVVVAAPPGEHRHLDTRMLNGAVRSRCRSIPTALPRCGPSFGCPCGSSSRRTFRWGNGSGRRPGRIRSSWSPCRGSS